MKSKEELRWIELLRKPAKTEEERREKEEAGVAFSNQLKEEIKDLSNELISQGSKFSDPWDMVNSKESYPEAIDILIAHLSKPYHDKNKEGIIRALTVKEAKGKASKALLEEYYAIPKEKQILRWTIGNAFTVIKMKDDVEIISSIVKDKTNGMSRQMFVVALGKIKTEEAKTCLKYLLNDEEMKQFAVKALGTAH